MGAMYDALTTTYRLSCPRHGETSVRLSRFRRLEELPGPQHPAVYRIEFACGCGDEHPGLVSHDDLDWAPLGLEQSTTFVNLMTSKHDPLADELTELAAHADQGGGVAVELLLLARGPAAAGLPVGVPACWPRASTPAASASPSAARCAGACR